MTVDARSELHGNERLTLLNFVQGVRVVVWPSQWEGIVVVRTMSQCGGKNSNAYVKPLFVQRDGGGTRRRGILYDTRCRHFHCNT